MFAKSSMTEAHPEELTLEILLEEGKAYMAQRLYEMPADFLAENFSDHPFVLQTQEKSREEGREEGREESFDYILK